MTGFIYIIKERENVVYVGETCYITERINSHKRCSKKLSEYQDIYQYIRWRGGWDVGGFSIEVIDDGGDGKQDRLDKERKYIKFYSERFILLNRQIGKGLIYWWWKLSEHNLKYKIIVKHIATKNKTYKLIFKKKYKFYDEIKQNF